MKTIPTITLKMALFPIAGFANHSFKLEIVNSDIEREIYRLGEEWQQSR